MRYTGYLKDYIKENVMDLSRNSKTVCNPAGTIRDQLKNPKLKKVWDAAQKKKKKKQNEAKDWMQGAVNKEHEGYCTPMTKETCTPRRKALALRFKKAARKRTAQGGTGWQGEV